MDNGLYTGMVMIDDLQKAFDTVNYSLSDKFQALGLNNISVPWFDSYLTNQTQKLDINSTFSKPRMVPDYPVVYQTVSSWVHCFS